MNPEPNNPDHSASHIPPRPKVAIIILNWNGLNDTLECLDSVFNLTYSNYVLIVVDNNSTQDPTSTLNESFPSVEIIRMDSNLGYAGGNNIGIKRGIELDCDYFWLLNNDAMVRDNTLSLLIDRMQEDQSLGLASPVIYNNDPGHTIQCVCGYVDWQHYDYGVILDLDAEVPKKYSTYLWGTALLIKKSVIDTIGILDEKYFAYAEDRQYCIRAQEAGFELEAVKNAAVLHKWAQASGGHDSPIKLYLAYRNNIFFWKEYLRKKQYLRFILKSAKESLSRAIRYEAKGLCEQAEACDNSLWNGLIGNGGGINAMKPLPSFYKKIVASHRYFWLNMLEGRFLYWLRTKLSL